MTFWIFFDCGRVLFGSRVAKREAEGTVHTWYREWESNPKLQGGGPTPCAIGTGAVTRAPPARSTHQVGVT